MSFYRKKWDRILPSLKVDGIDLSECRWIEEQFILNKLSFQQAKQLFEMSRKLKMWNENGLQRWVIEEDLDFWDEVKKKWSQIVQTEPDYASLPVPKKTLKEPKVTQTERKGSILKTCPACSDGYICCNMKILNIVENCPLSCSYCVLNTFYANSEIRVTKNLEQHLEKLSFDPEKQYHICTGQYSDSLALGDRFDILTLLCRFAQRNSNVCLELKTKMTCVDWFEKNTDIVPKNLIVSFSLNTQSVITHEELGTPSLKGRLGAARKLADIGIPIALHFHPMIRYQGYKKEYSELARTVCEAFKPEEVAFISQGSVNFIKQHQDKLANSFPESKLLRAEFPSKNVGHHLGYPEDQRVELYQSMNDSFNKWGGEVFRYLCMETPQVYQKTLGASWVQEFQGFGKTGVSINFGDRNFKLNI